MPEKDGEVGTAGNGWGAQHQNDRKGQMQDNDGKTYADEGYKAAKTFMKSLMPSHARKVKHYKEQPALYYKHKVESQIDAMHNDVVQLKSGGYIVIGATEAPPPELDRKFDDALPALQRQRCSAF